MYPLHQLYDSRPVGQAQQAAEQALVCPPFRLPNPHAGRAAALPSCVALRSIPARCVSISGRALLARSVVDVQLRAKGRCAAVMRA